jgi:hypothetical protein
MAKNRKREGAKAMFEQSIIYLLDAYRSEGKSPEQAKHLVLQDIEDARQKYMEADILPKSAISVSDPKRLLEDILKDVQNLGINPVAKKALLNKVIHLQKILQ